MIMSNNELSAVETLRPEVGEKMIKGNKNAKSTTCFIAINVLDGVNQAALLEGIEKLRVSLPSTELQLIVFGDRLLYLDMDLSGYHLIQLPQIDQMSTAYNYAVRQCDSDNFIFCKAGVWLEAVDYQATLDALQDFEAVTPNSKKVKAIDRINIRVEKTISTAFATHFFAIRRSAFEYLGGWDENLSDPHICGSAFSHLLTRSCSTLSLERSIFQTGPQPETPVVKVESGHLAEIHSFSGKSLEHYRSRLVKAFTKNSSLKSVPSLPHFVLAITSYNRKDYLQNCIESWLSTRTNAATWELVVADDGSTDGTIAYLKEHKWKDTKFTLIENHRTDIIHQTNTILQYLRTIPFDLCFKCDDDVLFKERGWDNLYWQVIRRTGYEHLIYYNLSWRPSVNKPIPHRVGQLVSHCDREYLQGAFFTITPNILREVGFFDAEQLGFRGYEHNDFSIRCCRAGYNNLENPFDLQNSNKFIDLQGHTEYVRAMSTSMESKLHKGKDLIQKRRVLYQNRIYVPLHQVNRSLDQVEGIGETDQELFTNRGTLYRMANDSWVGDRGVKGWLGSLMMKGYNLCLRNSWYWGPRFIKRLGAGLVRIGKDLVNIDH